MELRHLRYFVAVAEQLSFVKAAETLHISQPPLSRQIQELEEEIGTLLNSRQGNRIYLTAAGEYFKAEAVHILEKLDAVARAARQIGVGGARPLRLGAVNYLVGKLIPHLLGELQREYPDIKVEIVALPTESQEQAIRNGQMDFGFVRQWVKSEGLVYEQLGQEKLAVCHPRDKYAGRSVLRCLKSLEDTPFIALSPQTAPGLQQFIEGILKKRGIAPKIGYECNDAETVVRLVEEGLGWAVFSSTYLRTRDGEKHKAMDLDETIDFGLVYLPGELIPEAIAFRSVVREHFGKPGS